MPALSRFAIADTAATAIATTGVIAIAVTVITVVTVTTHTTGTTAAMVTLAEHTGTNAVSRHQITLQLRNSTALLSGHSRLHPHGSGIHP